MGHVIMSSCYDESYLLLHEIMNDVGLTKIIVIPPYMACQKCKKTITDLCQKSKAMYLRALAPIGFSL